VAKKLFFKNMKKILYLITQSDFGGAQFYVYNLAQGLKNDYKVIVAGGEQGYDGELAKKLNKENIKYLYLKNLKRAINPWRDFLAFLEIIKLIKKEKPDIVHLNSSKISIIGSLATFFYKLSVNCKKLIVIYTVHGWVFNEPMCFLKKVFYKYAEKFTAGFKDKLICVSDYDKQIAIKEKICPTFKLTTIHNGIKNIEFLPKKEAIEKLNKYSKSDISSPIIAGTIANLYKTKDLKNLIEAIHILLTLDFKLLTIIIGSGPEQNELIGLIKKYGLNKKVYLLGNIKNASRYLKAFDIYVCSSVKEGFPYSILEAMQAEAPIITTNVGGIPEMIKNNQSGLLINAKDPEIMAEKIKLLINNKNLRNKVSKNAGEEVKKNFNLNNFLNKTKKIYKKQ
jgi:glycosyltransferase involved in cell wall biosynthesis